MEYKEFNKNNIRFLTIKTDKFKNGYIEIRFRDNLKNVSLSTRFLLILLLSYTSKKYQTKREMIIALEELYNLGFSTDAFMVGENHISSFAVDFLHPKYVKEKSYLDDILRFLFETIQCPDIKNKHFNKKNIEILKEQIHVNLDRYKESPSSFARIDSKQKLFENSLSKNRIFGTHEELDKINNEMLLEEYQKLFNDSICDILIIGDLDMESIVAKISKLFKMPKNNNKDIPVSIINPIKKFEEETVKSTYSQTQLLEYFQFSLVSNYEKNFVGPLFSRILGNANMTDKLTRYLRIDNSLCYHCGFFLAFSDSYALVYVGLNKKQLSKAKKMISKAMDEMLNKDIDEKYFIKQKEKFLADLKLKEDDIYALIDSYYFEKTFNKASFLEYKEEIPKVTLDDLQKFAEKLKLSYIYILEEGVKNANN